jgi:hypothetical protein
MVFCLFVYKKETIDEPSIQGEAMDDSIQAVFKGKTKKERNLMFDIIFLKKILYIIDSIIGKWCKY